VLPGFVAKHTSSFKLDHHPLFFFRHVFSVPSLEVFCVVSERHAIHLGPPYSYTLSGFPLSGALGNIPAAPSVLCGVRGMLGAVSLPSLS